MYIQSAALHIMSVGQIGICGDHRYICDELDGLAKHIRDGQVIRIPVIGIQSQDRTGHGVHDILVGRFQYHVLYKIIRESSRVGDQPVPVRQFLGVGELSEEKQIYGLFVTETMVLRKALYQIVDIDPAVVELPFDGDELSVLLPHTVHGGDLGQPRKDSLSVGFTQSFFYVVHIVELRIDLVILGTETCQFVDLPVYFSCACI